MGVKSWQWSPRCAWGLLALLVGCSHGSDAAAPVETTAPSEPRLIAVTVAPVTLRPIQRTAEVVGTFHGWDEITLVAKVSGRVLRLHHDVGDIVRPGEVLLEIDDTDARLAVEEAARAVESELAKLGLTELPESDIDLERLPTVVRARLLAEHASQKLERTQQLRDKNITTQDEFEQVRTDFNVAEANHHQALIDARATLATARHRQSALATARQKWLDTRVVVPTPSQSPDQRWFVVAARRVSEGEIVASAPASEMFRLVVEHPLKLKATVPERYVSELQLGQPATLMVEAYRGRTFTGQVARIHPTIDTASRTFQVEVLVPNEGRELRPGSFAKVSILTRQDSSAPTIPEESLVNFAGVQKVFVVRDGKAQGVEVRTGIRGDRWLELVDGTLRPGDEVVTTGYTQLADGTPIRVRPASASTLK